MQRSLEYLREALETILRNKLRSFLTILGMLIGVAAVLSVYGLTTGASQLVNAGATSTDNPSLAIVPDLKQSDPARARLLYRDSRVVANVASDRLRRVTPFYSAFQSFSRRYQVRHDSRHLTALAFSWYGGDAKFKVRAGRALTVADQDAGAKACVVSPDLAYEFYGGASNALGQELDVNGTRFIVVGVADTGTGTAPNYFGGTYYFVLPYTTFQRFSPGTIDGIYLWLQNSGDETSVRRAVLAALHRTHGPRATYIIQSSREQLEQLKKFLDVVGAGLTAIGAISLFVAGTGIMNIMLVSVTERTREIGIRKAVGAKSGEIVVQFLMEAAVVSLIGGILGLLSSIGVLLLVNLATSSRFGVIPIPYGILMLYGLLFSLGIGLTFGTYPAWRASKLDPVAALRS